MKLFKQLCVFLPIFLLAVSCNSNKEQVIIHEPEMQSPLEQKLAGVDTFPDLVSAYLKTSKNGGDLQRKLNTDGAHNLDINGDGFTDTLRVKEHRTQSTFKTTRVFVIQSRTSLEPVVWQDVLTVDLSNNSGSYHLQISGNPLFYGNNYYLTPSYSRSYSTMAFVAWCYMPRPVFYLNAPMYRSSYHVVPRARFVERTRTIRTVKTVRSQTTSVNRGNYKTTNSPKVSNRVTKQKQEYQAKKQRFDKRQKGFTKQSSGKKVGKGLAGKDYDKNKVKSTTNSGSKNPNTPTRAGPNTNKRQKKFEKQDSNKKVGKGLAKPSTKPKQRVSKPKPRPKPKPRKTRSRSSRRRG